MKKVTLILLSLVFVLSCGILTACKPADEGIEPVSILTGWENGEDEGAYSVAVTGGKTAITYNKGGKEYAYAKRLISEASTLGEMKTLVFTAKAEVGSGTYTALLKLEGSGEPVEVWFMLSGAYTTFHWDLSAFDLATATRLLLFVDAGAINGAGKVTFKEMKFTADAADPDLAPAMPVFTPPTVTVNTYTSGDELVVKNFVDGGDGFYKIANDGNGANISYNKFSSRGAYANFKAVVKGVGLEDMKCYEVTLQGFKDTEVIIKPFDKTEKKVTLTGNVDTFKVDLRGISPSPDFANEIPIIFMIEGGKVAVVGNLKILSTKLTKEDIPVEFEHFDKFDVKAGVAEDKVAAKTMYAILKTNGKALKTLVVTAKGAANDKIGFKLADADSTATVTAKEITLGSANAETHSVVVSDISLTADKLAKLTITYTGSKPEITELYFTPTPIVEASAATAVAADMFVNAAAGARFAFDYTVAGKVSIKYQNSSWDSMVAYVDFGEGGYAPTMKIQGVTGGTAIIIIGGQEFKFEDTKMTGSEESVAFTTAQVDAIKLLKGIQVIRIFADFADIPVAEQNIDRTFTITQFTFAK